MMMRNLLTDPLSRSEDLGTPIPPSPHAVSVALPRWQDVIGYEEKRPEVIERLQGGYPRFVIHSSVRSLATRIAGDRPCLPFPSADVATRCARFVEAQSGAQAEVVSHGPVWGVATSDAGVAALRTFWQYTGLIVSTRRAEAAASGRGENSDAGAAREALRTELAAFYDCRPSDVLLAPTGMAAEHAALRAVTTRSPRRPTAQIGFPYSDTLKLQQTFGHGAVHLHETRTAVADLATVLSRQPLAACFSEIPCNPLLDCADLPRLSRLVRQHDVALVVDDTLASPVNVDLSRCADLVVTSLTKFVAGTGDVMGGAIVCNPRSPWHDELLAILSAQHEELLWGEDARVLAVQALGFPDRMRRHNENGLRIAERLRAHPGVERVWYPKWESSEAYEAVRRPGGGWGAVLSFVPRRPADTAARTYDRLDVSKGPSLGTVFTLACPFTLLAHYQELEWAESCGVSRYMIRLSVGLEDPEDIWRRLERALAAAV